MNDWKFWVDTLSPDSVASHTGSRAVTPAANSVQCASEYCMRVYVLASHLEKRIDPPEVLGRQAVGEYHI